MVRMRELRRTLGRVLGKALGRHVSGDKQEAHDHWRLTTLAHRQWAAIAVVKDVENVDHDTDEPHEEPHDPVTEDVGDGSQGFSGRPQDTPVLTSYVGHVAVNVWVGKVVIFVILTYLNFIGQLTLPN